MFGCGQAMPTMLQADCSAGTVVGQSLGAQHAHIIVSMLQSQVRSPNMQVPRAAVQLPVASASVMGHI
jgi:hypothetical protein